MSKSLSTDTLAYQLGVRPALQFRDMSKAPLRKVMEQVNAFMELDNAYEWVQGFGKEKPKGDPQKDAAVFYLLNHAVNCTRKAFNPLEPLPGPTLALLEAYHSQMALRGTRMFYYLLLICVRESRHHNGIKSSTNETELRAKYTDTVVDFMDKVGNLSESGAVDLLRNKAPDIPLGLWVDFMSEHFRKYSYGHAFGGEKWGQIADVARDFVNGKTSLEMLLDTSFTLAHNTSPAFDKGMLYDHYTGELLKVLDVQNSGQIPQLLYEKGIKCANDSDVHGLLQVARQGVPGDLLSPTAYVDWYKVEELLPEGKKNHYPSEKMQQAKLHGVPGQTQAKTFVKEVKAKQDQAVKEAEVLATVAIFPGQSIKKIARKDL